MLNLTPRFKGKLPDDLPAGLTELYQQAPTLTRLLLSRGVTDLGALDYSLSSLLAAEGLRDIDKAVQLLDEAIETQKRILIVGDFDCDGATSTALMMRVLTKMGAQVDFVVPDRFKYGYGLTPEIVQLGIDEYNPDLIVTVDNGISSHAGVDKANENGIQVIITDHHLTTKATPDAAAVVNPNQLDCQFASKALVGVGVAFYLLGRLSKYRREQGRSSVQVSRYLDLVALGTIADVGALDHNNRTLVSHGLAGIRSGHCCAGILALLELAGRDYHKISVQDFGFVIGPRINAAGRMDNMRIGIECLLTDDPTQAKQLAFELDKLNKERRFVEGGMREKADEILAQLQVDQDQANQENSATNEDSKQDRSLILYQDDWHQGVIGIVAGRLKESYYRPAIIFAPADTDKLGPEDAIKGSARSIPGIHIRDAIEHIAQEQPHLISHFGGHAMAAGLTIQKQHFDAFNQAFEDLMQQQDSTLFEEEQFTDGALVAQDFSLQFVDALINHHIWGQGFVPPQFDGLFSVQQFKILKDKHLKLSLAYPGVMYPIDAIWFNYDVSKWDYRASEVHVLFELNINEWNGNQSIQLMIKDLAVSKIE
ncbi:single-stranded-DNA-specific exonuclease RecJ [Psychrobacter sp. FDAARGOS_221]|uniref:single-stranded-DNA-specific exonuclease RecJ n=1 Tax=Psychrobacter sp. FDAARGOS_221 TaxID=1975705 RepID=UPI000BB58255|nr:single-stranded-DNA-specific exonuclease RecJ [Psychrobacter sp. FDAARGOS_221]PNK61943.1 single-stranded-DNA-specific exonuclease RecJ [Psychrobacter sp. FDAARGOS_221]